jgi:hypothetical protein
MENLNGTKTLPARKDAALPKPELPEIVAARGGEMTMSQNANLSPELTMAEANAQLTEVYVRQMATELAELARSAGCPRLSALLTLASISVETIFKPSS